MHDPVARGEKEEEGSEGNPRRNRDICGSGPSSAMTDMKVGEMCAVTDTVQDFSPSMLVGKVGGCVSTVHQQSGSEAVQLQEHRSAAAHQDSMEAPATSRASQMHAEQGFLAAGSSVAVPEWACAILSSPWESSETSVLRAVSAACQALGLPSDLSLAATRPSAAGNGRPAIARGGSERALISGLRTDAMKRPASASFLFRSASTPSLRMTTSSPATAAEPPTTAAATAASTSVLTSVKPPPAPGITKGPTSATSLLLHAGSMGAPGLLFPRPSSARQEPALTPQDRQVLPNSAYVTKGKPRQPVAVPRPTRLTGGGDALRAMFIAQALSYVGTPYCRLAASRKKSEAIFPSLAALAPSPGAHTRPNLSLDCSALIRQCVYDLRASFGFIIGGWNQAYQFDTLPLSLASHEHLRPGDLIFISGTYFDTSRSPKPHSITHVEIFFPSGDGSRRTIGSRHKLGCVQVHPDFTFESKTYHSMVYYFRSIDPWLQGECKSYCKAHRWQNG